MEGRKKNPKSRNPKNLVDGNTGGFDFASQEL
jgi:hypothetical protein